ncbi:MAG TPA: hypothetical protein VFE02_01170 [Candidatus Acidoferrales bacterium]|jgi:hypothetical protein|nr:hypothetical protein [Candidatus Acidoferrales bacterium]
MKMKVAWLVPLGFLPRSFLAQSSAETASAIPKMDHEPHHHLVLHSNYVKAFTVEVAPGDSVSLHSYGHNTIAIATGERSVIAGIQGKTVLPSKNDQH